MGETENYRVVLKRLGWVSIAVGLADIGVMVYCVSHDISYQSSLNIFAVVAGILFLRGSLGAVRVVTWFSAFILACLTSAIVILFPFMIPIDLLMAELRLHPFDSVASVLYGFIGLGFILWVYLQLRKPSVVKARVAAGQSEAPPRGAFVVGVLLAVAMAAFFSFTVHGEAGAQALRLAKAKEGAGYKYSISSLSWSGDHGRALVTAYNSSEIKSVDVEW